MSFDHARCAALLAALCATSPAIADEAPPALYVYACRSAEPSDCEQFRVAVNVDLRLPAQCFGALAEWVSEHPGWLVRRAHCAPWEVKA